MIPFISKNIMNGRELIKSIYTWKYSVIYMSVLKMGYTIDIIALTFFGFAVNNYL